MVCEGYGDGCDRCVECVRAMVRGGSDRCVECVRAIVRGGLNKTCMDT